MNNDIYIHSTAIVETTCIGPGTKIWAYSHILNGVEIGEDCNIGDHCYIEGGVHIGNHVTIKNGNMLFQGVILEDGVFVGPHVFFTNDLYPRSPRIEEAKYRYRDLSWLKQTRIKYGASLGAGSIILAGLTIGEYCTVGAGAVVTSNTLPFSLVVGNPASKIGWVCKCGLRLIEQGTYAKCTGCNREYQMNADELRMI